MKLAMAQMSMSESSDVNFEKIKKFISQAEGCDLIFFPELMLSPFFPQYQGKNADGYLITTDSPYISELKMLSKKHNICISPNVYLSENGAKYDASLFISGGEITGISKMVHIMQAENFYEQDYYTPSDSGFIVYDTPFGKIGVVICFDRHIPESIRTCALKGADMVIIPTANCTSENMELFEWELRVQAMHSGIYIAMCNRVGKEGGMDFAGQSMIAAPDGSTFMKSDGAERLIVCDIDISAETRRSISAGYTDLLRPEMYAWEVLHG